MFGVFGKYTLYLVMESGERGHFCEISRNGYLLLDSNSNNGKRFASISSAKSYYFSNLDNYRDPMTGRVVGAYIYEDGRKVGGL